MSEKPVGGFAPAYVTLYPLLVETARAYGYALCSHGSVTRDFDLVAVPWVNDAAEPEALIEALLLSTGGSLAPRWVDSRTPRYSDNQGEEKPHGRRSWSIYLGKAYIDISVMPKRPVKEESTT